MFDATILKKKARQSHGMTNLSVPWIVWGWIDFKGLYTNQFCELDAFIGSSGSRWLRVVRPARCSSLCNSEGDEEDPEFGTTLHSTWCFAIGWAGMQYHRILPLWILGESLQWFYNRVLKTFFLCLRLWMGQCTEFATLATHPTQWKIGLFLFVRRHLSPKESMLSGEKMCTSTNRGPQLKWINVCASCLSKHS